MSWAGIAALVLGLLLLKAIFDPDTTVYRCPYCSLVVQRYTPKCSRCKNQIGW